MSKESTEKICLQDELPVVLITAMKLVYKEKAKARWRAVRSFHGAWQSQS